MTETKDGNKNRTKFKTLPGGHFVMLGDNTYENGSLKYEGRFGIKYGRSSKEWVRMSYNDFALLILWALEPENKEFINSMVVLERKRGLAPELK